MKRILHVSMCVFKILIQKMKFQLFSMLWILFTNIKYYENSKLNKSKSEGYITFINKMVSISTTVYNSTISDNFSKKYFFLNQHHTFYKKRKILWYILYRDTNIVKSILKNWENSISSQVWKWDTIIYSFSFDLNFDFRIVKLGI